MHFLRSTYSSSEPGEQTLVVERTERVQLLHGRDQSLHGRGIHEVEGQQVVDPHGLQGQDGAGQIGPLDLGHGGGQHLVTVGSLRVQAVTLTRTRSPRTTRPLLGLSL